MSIFSSWVAAPNSLVITYTGRSTRSTISESDWPMPAVSTTTRSNPAVRRNASASASIALVAELRRRVAIERMKMRSSRKALNRIRSPSNAPPVRRRVGSTASTATRNCSNRRENLLSSSSVTVLLPAPPVPVTPTTGARCEAAAQDSRNRCSSAESIVSSSSADSTLAIVRSSAASPGSGIRGSGPGSSRCSDVRRTRSSIIPPRPSDIPSLG